ncbi:DUSAM domain-containing protein [Myxococcaceae bacterium GXIMD 01537]
MDPLDEDWYRVRMLDNRVQQGEALELDADVRELLRRTAPTVAIPQTEVESSLASVASATALVDKMRRRMDEGTNRIMDALHRMYRLEEKGDLAGARQQMRAVLAVELVPHIRDIAEGELERLSDLP